jgi:hypothetical protein
MVPIDKAGLKTIGIPEFLAEQWQGRKNKQTNQGLPSGNLT